MATFNLELRVTIFGSILTWKIFLEDSTNDSNNVLDWDIHPNGYRFKLLPDYRITDNTLDVFAACQGIMGGFITCDILIDGEVQADQVKAMTTDRIYAHESYPV